jgi:SAM-dependent methyltransferase
MGFEVPAESYGRFMGRYSTRLASEFLTLIRPRAGQRALDVGCGPGLLTEQLTAVLGADAVAAIDPSRSFVEAARERLPGVDIREGIAEQLPFSDEQFDVTLAQLVVHFMTDPVAALREMARVTRPGGVVAASVWDYAGDRAPLSVFWRVVRRLDPSERGECDFAGAREGHLVSLFGEAGLRDVRQEELTIHVPVSGFDDWWAPFLLGVGPAGSYVARLGETVRERVRAQCAELLPTGPFFVDASAWVAVGSP